MNWFSLPRVCHQLFWPPSFASVSRTTSPSVSSLTSLNVLYSVSASTSATLLDRARSGASTFTLASELPSVSAYTSAWQPEPQLVPWSKHRPLFFLVSRALSLVACQCVGNTLSLHLWKHKSLCIDQCVTFNLYKCVSNRVSLHLCNSATFCFDWCLGLHAS